MDYQQLGLPPADVAGGAYNENPADKGAMLELSPQVSGIEDILRMLKAKLNLPMLPPMPPGADMPVGMGPQMAPSEPPRY